MFWWKTTQRGYKSSQSLAELWRDFCGPSFPHQVGELICLQPLQPLQSLQSLKSLKSLVATQKLVIQQTHTLKIFEAFRIQTIPGQWALDVTCLAIAPLPGNVLQFTEVLSHSATTCHKRQESPSLRLHQPILEVFMRQHCLHHGRPATKELRENDAKKLLTSNSSKII